MLLNLLMNLKEILKPKLLKLVILIPFFLIALFFSYRVCWVGIDCPGCDYLNIPCFIFWLLISALISYIVISALIYIIKLKK